MRGLLLPMLTTAQPPCYPAIHMAFDCAALAVGLFASVMATWHPNTQYSYG
jgi:hypothetical protein